MTMNQRIGTTRTRRRTCCSNRPLQPLYSCLLLLLLALSTTTVAYQGKTSVSFPKHKLLTLQQELQLGQAIQAAHNISAALPPHPVLFGLDETTDCVGLGGRAQVQQMLQDGAAARQTLALHNVRLVHSICAYWIKQSRENGMDVHELTQEGFVGLLKAVDKYDFRRGLRFSTYATPWITLYARNFVHRQAIKLPQNMVELRQRYRKLQGRQQALTGCVLNVKQAANELQVSEKRLKTVLRLTQTIESLDEPLRDGSPKAEVLPAPPQVYSIDQQLLRQALEESLAILSPHERDVLRLQLGLDGQPLPATHLAQSLDTTVARLTHTKREALRKLRQERGHVLEYYKDE